MEHDSFKLEKNNFVIVKEFFSNQLANDFTEMEFCPFKGQLPRLKWKLKLLNFYEVYFASTAVIDKKLHQKQIESNFHRKF